MIFSYPGSTLGPWAFVVLVVICCGSFIKGLRGELRGRAARALEKSVRALCDEYAADPAPDTAAYDLKLQDIEQRFARLYRGMDPAEARRVLTGVMRMHGDSGRQLAAASERRRADPGAV